MGENRGQDRRDFVPVPTLGLWHLTIPELALSQPWNNHFAAGLMRLHETHFVEQCVAAKYGT